MEQDRYQKNHVLYIIGLLSLVASLSLLAFTLYILPYLVFGWRYDAPGFIHLWKELLRVRYHFSPSVASQIIGVPFFLLTLLFAFIANFASNRMDNEIYSTELTIENKEQNTKKSPNESIALVLKILLIIVLVFVGAELFHWLIYTEVSRPQR